MAIKIFFNSKIFSLFNIFPCFGLAQSQNSKRKMTDQVAIAVGEMRNEIKALKAKRSKTTTKRSAKKKPTKKKQTLKKWKLVRVQSQNSVLYQKVPKKGYILVIPKNTIVRDTTENRTKYAAVAFTTATVAAANT